MLPDKRCLSHGMCLFQVMMTLHFLNADDGIKLNMMWMKKNVINKIKGKMMMSLYNDIELQ